ncbi:hypothetical protein [Actinoplanes sp. OR16]|uniref:hypothetical protein n=1 Tax=Actinoplanes sp. OR16 TaxID=946334 RepID=UPI000FDA58AE|nr:hypothetical protein [Actinoplanes sp. OR16]
MSDVRREPGFQQWIAELAGGEPFDWDADGDDPEFLDWITEVYAGNGAMPMELVNPLVFARRVELAQRALQRIAARAEVDLGPLPGLTVVTTPPDALEPTGVVRVGGYGQRITGLTFAEVALTVADNVQEWVTHDRSRIWPVCPEHRRGLHPQSADGVPSWVCREVPHVVSPIID